MLSSFQFAVSVPGGVEPLVRVRRCFREAVQADPELGVECEVDVDMVNQRLSFHGVACNRCCAEGRGARDGKVE